MPRPAVCTCLDRRIEALSIDYEQWAILYRLFLQVRLRRSPGATDALVAKRERTPPAA